MENDAVSSRGQPSSVERRLATILMADVFGYSRMMGENEERTVQILRGHRSVFDELLKVHRGRIFNTAGDAILAEFPSAVEAVRCATEIQAALRTRNEHLPPEQQMWFRIGINLGDVIVQEGDLLGDGVNVAARIQTIAEPGGVCISGSVYDQIQNKLTLQIRQLGEKTFKNIAQPIRTFSISDDGGAPRPAGLRWRAPRKWPIAATAAVIALIAVGGAAYWLYRDFDQRVVEDTRRTEESQRAAQAQRKDDLEKAAAVTAQKEAKLVSELQAAKDALTQAEASKRKAEQDRLTAEVAQREAKLQGELKAAKDALQKAEQTEKKADQERKVATAAVKSAEVAVQKTAEPPQPFNPKASTAATSATAPPANAASRTAESQVASASPALGNDWIARRTCDAFQERSAFNDSISVVVRGDEFILEKGQDGQPGYFSVRGRPAADGTLVLTGTLVSASRAFLGRPAAAFFEGRLVDGRYDVQGHMGRRACRLTLERRRT